MYVFAGTPNMYSNPRLLMTSTMKSDPGRSIVFASSTTTAAGPAAGRASTGALAFLGGGGVCCASAAPGFVTARAAPAAAVFKKFRRSTDLVFVFLAMKAHLATGFYAVKDENAILECAGFGVCKSLRFPSSARRGMFSDPLSNLDLLARALISSGPIEMRFIEIGGGCETNLSMYVSGLRRVR